MQHTKKYLIFLTLFSLFSSQLTRAADLASDPEQLFNSAELVFPQWFNPPLNTNSSPPAWPYYRGPYNKNVYLGINSDGFVYVLGGAFGNTPVNAGTIQEVFTLLNSNIGTQTVPFGPGARSGTSSASQRLSVPEKTIAAINNINGLNKIAGDWLAGEWGTFYFDNGRVVEEKINFNLDGTYQSESINKKVNQEHGKWLLVASPEKDSMNLTLWNSTGALAGSYPIEREGNNSFRLINQSSKPDVRSILFTNSAAVARFPGMFFLGNFEYINYKGAANRHLFRYHFNNNGTVRRLIYGDFSLDRKLQSDTTGTWSINSDSSQFQLTFADQAEHFTIKNATSSTVSMYTSKTEYQYWKRFQESILPNVDPFVGEFQGNKTQGYLSIKKAGNNYLIDVVEGHRSGKAYYQVPGTVLDNGQLSITVPKQYNGDTQLIMQAGYNRLIVKETPGTFFLPINDNYYMEKVSRKPLTSNPVNIFGQWRNTSSVGKGTYYIFLDDGHYYRSSVSYEYGTYRLSGNSISMTPSCGDSYTNNFEIADHRIKLNTISYNPVPGIRELGNIGTQLENTLFKSQLDRFLETNGAKLKPHPLYAGVFVFAEETKFSTGYVAMTFKPDGTGNQFSGSILDIYDAWDLRRFIGTRIDSFLFNIDYYVAIDGDKESVVYYNNGGWVSDYRGVLKFGSFKGNPNSAKELKLYHGRSAVCYTITNNDGGIVLPIKK
ncbi:MAG: hypothetical protein KAH20_02780 [Methylococcales bacterium]|nr:hypothetical protein [Methylococcales bacterium]